MSKTIRTHHAEIRCAQRAIPEFHLELLRFFGEATEQKSGSYILSFSSEAQIYLRELLAYEVSHWDKLKSTYAVLSDSGVIITAGHLRKQRGSIFARKHKYKSRNKWGRSCLKKATPTENEEYRLI